MRAKDAVGRFGEEVAARHLTAGGMRVLDRNWRCPAGELDLVAAEGDVLVFCEVKTRSTTGRGLPAEAVRPGKARRVRALARQWLAEHPGWPGEVRFDVVGVVCRPRGGPEVVHLRGAF